MTISYSWAFPTLDVVYSEDGFSNVVRTVHWTYTAVDGEYTAYCYGAIDIPGPGQPFTQFDSLTPQIVKGWVVGIMGQEGVDAMNESMSKEISAKKNPTGGAMTPPWV